MNDLFDIYPSFAPPPPKHAGTGQACSKCLNGINAHQYRPDWIYCKVTRCNRSQFGIKKVRSRQDACPQFVEAT